MTLEPGLSLPRVAFGEGRCRRMQVSESLPIGMPHGRTLGVTDQMIDALGQRPGGTHDGTQEATHVLAAQASIRATQYLMPSCATWL